MQLEKTLANQVFRRATHNHGGSGIGKFDDAVLVQAVDAFTDGVQDAGLIALQLAVPGLEFPLEANHLGVGFNPCNHFQRLEWLGNIVGATQAEAFHFGLQVVQGRQEYNGAIGRFGIGFEALAHFITIHFRHHDIQQNHFRTMAVGKVQRFFAFVGDQKPVAFVFQGLVEDFQVLRVVINQQNRHLGVLTDNFSHRNMAG